MGHQAILYGRIQDHWEGAACRWPIVPEYNRAVLESLPAADNDWPFLTRHFFAVAPLPFHGAADRGVYRGRVIHFGASTKDEAESPEWSERFLAKLEQHVLARLLWRSAKVHVESAFAPERVYVYRADRESLHELLRALDEQRFAERVDSAMRWTRRQEAGTPGRPDWLL